MKRRNSSGDTVEICDTTRIVPGGAALPQSIDRTGAPFAPASGPAFQILQKSQSVPRYTHSVNRVRLLLNPSSGSGHSGRLKNRILQGLIGIGFDVELEISESSTHLRQLARTALDNPETPLLCGGGDGTNRIIIDSLLQEAGGRPLPRIGFIPSGRGNSFVRDLGIVDLPTAFEAIAAGKTTRVDVGRINASGSISHFINCLGAGFISDVGRFAAKTAFLGNISYALGVIWETLRFSSHQFRLEIDGVPFEEDLLFLEISNSRMTGGTMAIAPQARIDDGELDLVVVGRMSRCGLLKTFPKIYSGSHGKHPAVRFLRGRRIRLSSPLPELLLPDGDLDLETPVEIEVLPERIECFRHPGAF